MSCHTIILKILDRFILSFVLVPIETHATTLDLFLTFLAQQKFTRQDSSNPVVLIKFYFYLFTTPNIKIRPHFSILQKVSQLSFSFITENLPSFLQPASNIFLITSFPCFPKIPLPIFFQKPNQQSSWRVFIELLRLCSILETNSSNSLCHNLQNNKTHQKQKHLRSTFFNVVEALRR